MINGWLYGFLQPIGIHRSKYVGKKFNISLYSIDQDTKLRWWIGRIRDVDVIPPEDSSRAYTVYKTRGWLVEMEQQLRDVNASVNEFRKSKPETFFALRYRPQSLDLLESPLEFRKTDPAVRVTYYVLLNQKEVPHFHQRNGGFTFVPGNKAGKQTAVAAYEQQSQNIDLVQNRMQTAIYHQLAAKFGDANIGAEIPTGQGSEIDVVVKQTDGEFDFYEIKTSYSIRLNIRQALGQLLEYAYYPQPKTVKRLIIVSDKAVTPESRDYLDSLRQRFGLPVYYQRYNPAKQLSAVATHCYVFAGRVSSPFSWRNRMRMGAAGKWFIAGIIFATISCSSANAQQFDQKLFSEMRWRCIGPFRGGRTVAISGVPRQTLPSSGQALPASGQANVFYMAAVNGGVWKTTDFGNTWNPIFDDQPTGSVGALAVAPSDPNIIYVGSGEGLQRPDLATGDGVYKSTDAGKTWTHLGSGKGGLRDAQQITAILIDPKNPNRVFVTAEGHPYGPNAERGVFRSTDGGETFQKVLYKDTNTGAADLAFDPTNAQTIYAVLWAARVAPWEVRSGASIYIAGSGLYKSTDGGDTWKPLMKGLPGAEDGLGRIGIAVAPSQANRVYASVEAKKNAGVYRSDDAGETWKQVNSDHRIGGRGPGAMGIAVAPDNPDVLYVANTTTWKSTDGGKTFTGFKGAPGGDDYQHVWISPENPQIIALTSDQGAVISVNGGETWSSWYNQPTAQFYHVTTDNRFPYWVYGAQQESGSAGTMSRSDYGEITFREWHSVGVFEYGDIAVDPLDSNIIYGAKLTRTKQDTGEVADIAPEPVRRGEYRYDRTLPVVFSRLDPHTLYFAANVLFKSTNAGNSWQVISPDLTRESYEIPPNLGVFAAADPEKGKHRGVIYAVAPSYKEADTIWAGTDDGLIHITRDGGKSWQNVTPPQLQPWSKVSILEASRFDAGTAYAAINSFRLDDLRAHLYRTRDYGKTWTEITKGIPEGGASNVVREDPARKGLLFAGTEGSVYVSFNDGDDWQPLQLNLPHTSMRDLTIHGDDLIVATHGRSFWILDDITPLRQLNAEVAKANAHLFAPQEAMRFRWNRNTDTPLPPETPAGKNPPDGAVIDYYLASASTKPVILEILDEQQRLVRRYSSTDKLEPMEKIAAEHPIPMYWVRRPQILSAQAGTHRFVWDLHYAPPDSLEHEYPISAILHDTPKYPLGAWVLPGNYTVKLTADGRSYTQPLIVKMDPRITVSPADLRKQFEMQSGAVEGMNKSFEVLAQVQSVRAQLKERAAKAGKGDLVDKIAALDKQTAELEGAPQSSFFGLPPGAKQPENFSTLNQHFGSILAVADSADAAPTSQATTVYKALEDALVQLETRWAEIRQQEIPALNTELKKANLPQVDANKSPAAVPTADGDGDDEP